MLSVIWGPEGKFVRVTILLCTALVLWGLFAVASSDLLAQSTSAEESHFAASPVGTADACPEALVYGETVVCSIDVVGEVDEFSFVANKNDVILLRVARTSGLWRPRLVISAPSDIQVCIATNGDPIASIESCKVDVSGKFVVKVDDTFSDKTGAYELFIQRQNKPENTLSIGGFGQEMTGTIESAQTIRTYSFGANGNDIVLLQATRTSGLLRPRLRLYNRFGDLVCSESNGDPEATIGACKLEVSGGYALLVDDTFLAKTGDYTLFTQRLNNPGNTIAVGEYGQTFQNSIDSKAAVKSYSLVVNGGDRLNLRVLRSSGLLRPRARVISRVGVQVCNASNGDPSITISGCELEVAGGYVILVDDTFSEKTGDFSIHVQRPNLPGSAILFDAYDQTKNGTIDEVALGHAYKFIAKQGDVVRVVATQTSGRLSPQLQIINRHGVQECAASRGDPTTTIGGCVLSVAGTHYILLQDSYGEFLGDYDLYLTCTNEGCIQEPPPPPPPPPIVYDYNIYLPLVVR